MLVPRIWEMINSIAWQQNPLLILIILQRDLELNWLLRCSVILLKNVAFAIFGREPNGLRSLTRPHLCNKKSVYAPSRDYSVTPVCSGKNLPYTLPKLWYRKGFSFSFFEIGISRF